MQKQLDLFPNTSTQKIIHGDCLDEMRKMDDNSIDFIVTDPPYGLHFMGKDWDDFKHYKMNSRYVETCRGIEKIRKGQPPNQLAGTYDDRKNDEFQEFIYNFGLQAIRVLKHGSYIGMFGAPRRHHRQMIALEDAGFEIRDCIAWIFGQGFPKSHNFGRKLEGDWKKYGIALKPVYEPIILAMKPLDGTFAHNAEKWGVAGINIDDSRIGIEGGTKRSHQAEHPKKENGNEDRSQHWARTGHNIESIGLGRWPSNLILDEEAAEQLDQMTGILKSGELKPHKNKKMYNGWGFKEERNYVSNSNCGGASRFFYCSKTSTSERNYGLDQLQLKDAGFKNSSGRGISAGDPYTEIKKQNNHPTVKPLSLMRYIIKLLAPPGNPTLLDPFAGSGSTIIAAKQLGISAIGIEKEAEYCEIANTRLKAY